MHDFKLPAIGEGVVEGEIVRWLKQPGDAVAANEPLVEVMTDKATVEIPSPHDAVVQEHRVAEGATAAVGSVIAILDRPGVAVQAPAAKPPASPAARPSPAAPMASPLQAPRTPDVPAKPRTPSVAATAPAPSYGSSGGPVLATPAARALAREAGIDLGSLHSDRGRITKTDVLQAQQSGARLPNTRGDAGGSASNQTLTRPAPARSPLTAGEDEFVPFRGLRRKIAEGMVKSYSTAVHYTYVEEIDVGRLVEIRKQARAAAAEQGVTLTYLPFIVKAVLMGLKKFPMVNAELDEANARIILKKRYSIGVATATPQGLIVPVVHDADRMSLLDVASEIARISEAARTGTASREELTGSTFTITSLGQIGGLLATPILNYPEVGILGVHAIRKVPVVGPNDQIVVGHRMNLSVSLDHRVVDGYEGASFLQEVKRYLEDPTLLLLAGV